MQVATSDGKIKLFGRPGVERTLYSSAKYPFATKQLLFLNNRGVLVRVAKVNEHACRHGTACLPLHTRTCRHAPLAIRTCVLSRTETRGIARPTASFQAP